ncbi:MAG: hypothetical protein MK078_16650 [Crocinitomicaceae bacterium]|nr:hypothetical protein [Crocinitomicaceae bacterium]
MDLDNIKYNIGRFLLPALFLVAGIYLMVVATSTVKVTLHNGKIGEVTQSPVFLYASLVFIIGSVVWILYISGLIKKMIGLGLMVVMLGLGVYVLYYNYKTVNRHVADKKAYERQDLEIRQRMSDIKLAQQAYKEVNGFYTNSTDDLVDFVKNGKKLVIKKSGAVPERKITPEERDYLYNDDRPIDFLMTEQEAALLAVSPLAPADLAEFIRDTSFVPVMEAVFMNDIYLEKRDKMGVMPFIVDSLTFVPFTTTLVRMDTSHKITNEIRVPTLEFEMVHPRDTSMVYTVGDTTANHLRESWIEG